MKILLVSATLSEIERFIKTLEIPNCLEKNFFRGFAGYRLVDILVTGIGAAATAANLSVLLENSHYDLVINAGICGSFKNEYKNGSTVNIISEVWGDLGAEDHEEFLDLFDLGILDGHENFYTGNQLINKGNVYSSYFAHLPDVKGITVNTSHGNKKSIDKIIRKYDPDVESMEGAAIFILCKSRGINFQCIRSISNFVEPRNRETWNIDLALSNLTLEINNILSVI